MRKFKIVFISHCRHCKQVFKLTGQSGWFAIHIRISDQLLADGVNGIRLFVYELGL